MTKPHKKKKSLLKRFKNFLFGSDSSDNEQEINNSHYNNEKNNQIPVNKIESFQPDNITINKNTERKNEEPIEFIKITKKHEETAKLDEKVEKIAEPAKLDEKKRKNS